MMTLPPPDPSVHTFAPNRSRAPARRQLALLRHFGLAPDSRLLEIGCGNGRLVYELADYLRDGTYAGFDIGPGAIAWLNEHYAPLLPNYRFDLVDATNAQYRKASGGDPTAVRFPYDDDRFNFACAFSVFTHMRLPEIIHYLTEVRRVLEPGGKGIMTFYSITERDENPCATHHATNQRQAFVPIGEGIYSIDPKRPERNLAFDEAVIRSAADAAGLETVETLEGRWHEWPAGRESFRSVKDTFVFRPVEPARTKWRLSATSSRSAGNTPTSRASRGLVGASIHQVRRVPTVVRQRGVRRAGRDAVRKAKRRLRTLARR